MNFEKNKLTRFGSILLTCLFLNGCVIKGKYPEPSVLEAPKHTPIQYMNLSIFENKNSEVCTNHKLPKICKEVRFDLYKYYLIERNRIEETKQQGDSNLCWLIQNHYKNQAICEEVKRVREQDSHRKDVILEVLDESIKALEAGAVIPNDEGKLDNVGIETFSPSQIPVQE